MLRVVAPVFVTAGTKVNLCPTVYAGVGVAVPVTVFVPATEVRKDPYPFWTSVTLVAWVKADGAMARGIAAVEVWVPSLSKQVLRPVAVSVKAAAAAVLEMVVPVTGAEKDVLLPV